MIQVLERFAKIMNHVSAHDEAPCRLRDLAAMLGVSPSACANIVSSMVKLGYLESAEQGGYRIPSRRIPASFARKPLHEVTAGKIEPANG